MGHVYPLSRSVIVIFPLMPEGEHGHRCSVVDFVQRHVAFVAEGDQQFPQARFVFPGLAAGEREGFEQCKGLADIA
ncbi:hypothetical protein D9M69_251720 [compost metagenome]